MAEVINLRRARKAKARTDAQNQAAQNRLTFGRSKSERALTQAQNEHNQKQHEAHRLTTAQSTTSPDAPKQTP